MQNEHVVWFSQLGMDDVERVGGRHAGLFEGADGKRRQLAGGDDFGI